MVATSAINLHTMYLHTYSSFSTIIFFFYFKIKVVASKLAMPYLPHELHSVAQLCVFINEKAPQVHPTGTRVDLLQQ